MIDDTPTAKLNEIISRYQSNPEQISLAVVDRLCAKLDLARTIYTEYDNTLRKPVSSQEATLQTIEALVLLLLQWNRIHGDYKVLNTLLKSTDRYSKMHASIIHKIHRHAAEVLCDE